MGALWQCEYSEVRAGVDRGLIIVCRIGLKIDGEWIWRSNGADGSDIEAVKGGFSDARKRAATLWGIGAYLYGFESPWVNIVAAGKSFVIAKNEYPRLRNIAAKSLAAYLADPKNFRAPEPDGEPERPAFTPAPAPPPRPAPAAVAPPSDTALALAESIVARLRGAELPEIAAIVLDARKVLAGQDAAIAVVHRSYADAAIRIVTKVPGLVDETVALLNSVKPDAADRPRLGAAVQSARGQAARAAAS